MFQNLPVELQCYIFRNYLSTAEKINLLHIKVFEKALLTKYSWRHLPQISLKTYMCISKNYLHILKPGLYLSESSRSLYEIVLHAKTGVLTLECFTLKNNNGSALRRPASTNYSIPEFQEILMKIRNSSQKISDYFYVNKEFFVCLDRPHLFKDNIIYRTGYDQLSCLQEKNFYILHIRKSCPLNELQFYMANFMRKKGKHFEKHHSYDIMKLTHWRKCLTSTLKVKYTYRPRKKMIEAKGVRKLLYA